MTMNDSEGLIGDGAKAQKGDGNGIKREFQEGGQRLWLRVYETHPAQMLNADDLGRYTLLADKAVW